MDRTGSESSVRITQPIDLFSRRSARREALQAGVSVEESNRDLALLALRSTLRAAYVEVLTLDRALPIAREDRDVARQLEQLVNRRADLGETREVDRLRIQVEQQRAEDLVEQLEVRRATAERVLRLLVGAALPEAFVLADLPTPAPGEFPAIRARVLDSHPRLRVSEAIVRQREAQLRLARANRLPEPSIGVASANELDKNARSIIIGASIPVWGWNRGEIAIARAGLDRATGARDAARRDIERELTELFFGRDAVARHVRRLQGELLPRARETLRIAEIAYRNGETSQLDYLDARRTYVALQQEYLAAVRELAIAESRLEQFTGEVADARH